MKIGPKNYFQLPASDDEGMEHPISFIVNADFQGNALEDLARSDGRHWVHCELRNVLFLRRRF